MKIPLDHGNHEACESVAGVSVEVDVATDEDGIGFGNGVESVVIGVESVGKVGGTVASSVAEDGAGEPSGGKSDA